jgi:hypothetical protein
MTTFPGFDDPRELYALIAAFGTYYWLWCRLVRAVMRRRGL